LQLKVSSACIECFQERAKASSFKYTPKEIVGFSNTFLKEPAAGENHPAKPLIFNRKNYEESSKELLLLILDRAMNKK
jgi:hypothetical protein